MQGLGKAKGINIKAEEAYGTSPENVLRSAKEKQKLFKDKGTVQIYCLFDKDDCDDEKFKKVIQQCKKAGFVDAISVPCYEYWLLSKLDEVSVVDCFKKSTHSLPFFFHIIIGKEKFNVYTVDEIDVNKVASFDYI